MIGKSCMRSCVLQSRNGASFYVLFRSAMYFGIISRRRIHLEAITYERERNADFLSPFGYSSLTITAAVDAVCSMEYTMVGYEGPGVLLVHGFGAFLEHFRSNVSSISPEGYRVWAVTLLGFGRSEKPNVMYSEHMWVELLRDFIIDVVGEPVHLVGNSVGGYFVAMFAAIWPILSKSVVLLNPEGSVVPVHSSFTPPPETGQASWFSWFGSRLLLLYLRYSVANILKNYYPTKPERADHWLLSEMLRASNDPGATFLLESVLSLKLAIPLNHLFHLFGGKVLVMQLSCLSKSKSRRRILYLSRSEGLVKKLFATTEGPLPSR